MNKISAILIGVFMVLGMHTAMALSGSMNTDLYPNEKSAVAAAKTLIGEINRGRNISLAQTGNNLCLGTESKTSAEDSFKIDAVWVKRDTGYEKMYLGVVGYKLECDGLSLGPN